MVGAGDMSRRCFVCGVVHKDRCPFSVSTDELISRFLVHPSYVAGLTGLGMDPAAPSGPTLREAVEAQIMGLTAGLNGWEGGKELPKPDPDFTRYEDAHAAAVAKCTHEDVENILFARQWKCLDCGRLLDRKQLGRSWWAA